MLTPWFIEANLRKTFFHLCCCNERSFFFWFLPEVWLSVHWLIIISFQRQPVSDLLAEHSSGCFGLKDRIWKQTIRRVEYFHFSCLHANKISSTRTRLHPRLFSDLAMWKEVHASHAFRAKTGENNWAVRGERLCLHISNSHCDSLEQNDTEHFTLLERAIFLLSILINSFTFRPGGRSQYLCKDS